MIVLASLSTEQAMAIADKLQEIVVESLSCSEKAGHTKFTIYWERGTPRFIDYFDVEEVVEDVLNDRD